MRRKYEQVQNYARIMKYRRQGGKVEEVNVPNALQEQTEGIVEEKQEEKPMPSNEEFEDPFEDEFEQEEGWVSASDSEEEEEEMDMESGTKMSEEKSNMEPEGAREDPNKQVYLGNNKGLKKGEILQFDNAAYDMLHRLNVEWPSLSIDFVAKPSPFEPLPSFQSMQKYPFEVFTVQGSCNNSDKNSIYFAKWSQLHRTKFDDHPDPTDDDDPHADEDPVVTVQELQTGCDVNRIRTLNNSPIVAIWNDLGDSGQLRMLELSQSMQKLQSGVSSRKREPCKEVVLHTEAPGFALSWNPHKVGELVAGDQRGVVSVYANNQNYTKWTKSQQYSYHKASVQDIAFSPEQPYVFASCSADGTLQVVDMRANSFKKAQLKLRAHHKDVNVCDWNGVARHLLVTGSDDCSVKVWDLRMVSEGVDEELLKFAWHTEPITSVRFQPNEESVVAVASEDNRLTIWDMAMQNEEQEQGVPNELMFLHQGQEEIKEVLFHPVYYEMLASTALDTINIFKPSYEAPEISEGEKEDQEDLNRPPIREQDLDKYLEKLSLE